MKYPGSKWTLAEWIIGEMPPHKMYLEPFFGSGAVFFSKEPSQYETINDKDGLVVNFFRACRDHPDDLARAVNLTPFSREEFLSIQERSAGEEIQLTGDCVEDARRFLVRCCQGFGSKLADRVGWKNTKHPNGPNNAAICDKIPEAIYEAALRLKNAQIENTDAIQLIKDCNDEKTLIYADPPYFIETRGKKRLYRVEMMIEEDHSALLAALLLHKGPVIISGYDHKLYNETLKGWRKIEHTLSGSSLKVAQALILTDRVKTLFQIATGVGKPAIAHIGHNLEFLSALVSSGWVMVCVQLANSSSKHPMGWKPHTTISTFDHKKGLYSCFVSGRLFIRQKEIVSQ